jgi:hypothetical protein
MDSLGPRQERNELPAKCGIFDCNCERAVYPWARKQRSFPILDESIRSNTQSRPEKWLVRSDISLEKSSPDPTPGPAARMSYC